VETRLLNENDMTIPEKIETLLVGRILYGFKILHGNVENIRTIESGKVLF